MAHERALLFIKGELVVVHTHSVCPLLACLVWMTFAGTSQARSQELRSGRGSSGRIEGTLKFVPAPYVNYSRSLKFSVGVLPLVMFNPVPEDTTSPSSIAGGLGLYTTNDSWLVALFTKVFLDEDNWRVTAAGGRGTLNFQFYLDNPIDSYLPYSVGTVLAFVELQRRLFKKLYIGVNYIYVETETTTDIPQLNEAAVLRGLGLKATVDQRLNLYYPREHFQANITYTTYPAAFANEFVSNKIQLDYTQYFAFRRNLDVLAGRFFLGLGIGDLQFNQQFIVGAGADIRGYTQGRYRGNSLLALQGEYRWNFAERFGAVGFFGLASVFKTLNNDDSGTILPGIGAGFRYTIIPDAHMNIGMDIAAGKGDWGLYFRLGEAF